MPEQQRSPVVTPANPFQWFLPRQWRKREELTPAASVLARFNEGIEQWFDQGIRNLQQMGFATVNALPQYTIEERDDAYCLAIDLPDVQEKDITLSVESGMLDIQARQESRQKSLDNGGNIFQLGQFRQVVPLPPNVAQEKIEAEFEGSRLTLILPKISESGHRSIPLNGGRKGREGGSAAASKKAA